MLQADVTAARWQQDSDGAWLCLRVQSPRAAMAVCDKLQPDKQYVAQIVIDYAFDVCALNELKPDQKKDLLSLLPDYKIESWGRDSHIIGDVGEGVGILYRKDKFRLLSSGHFFLSPDITKSAVAWDAKFRRLAVWAQLQDKTTGDIFFYCATHLEQAGQVAKRKGAAVVVEQMLAVSEAVLRRMLYSANR